jgi:16S rRNA (cytidine1402-2'-O)-methyltransferase
MANLYVIATPIGNLGDITERAVKTLSEVDFIACEDTRVSKILLDKFNIVKPVFSFNSHATSNKFEKIFTLLEEGKNIALVSDAGTPCISDPGSILVREVREKFGNEVKIIPIPGASALVSALSVSGLPTSEFVFIGFLPHKKGRETIFKEIAVSERTFAFYESPHRIMKTLDSLVEHIGKDAGLNRRVVIARELTKIYEEIVSGNAVEVRDYFLNNKDKIRGEFVVMIEGL